MSTPTPVFLRHLIDDAAIFPPGNAAVDDAVAAHLGRQEPQRLAVGPFVVDAARAAAAGDAAATLGATLDIALVVRPATAAGAAIAAVEAHAGLRMVALEVAVTDEDGEIDLALARLAEVVTPGKSDPDRRLDVWIELPPDADRATALAALARSGHGLKIRTGGLTAAAFPAPRTLAELMKDAADRGIAVKCTAGLHGPVRHPDPDIGATRHGFLNILVAAARARAGASLAELVVILSSEDDDVITAAMRLIPDDEMARTRRFFRSYGSCSITEPLTELARLGLVDERIAS